MANIKNYNISPYYDDFDSLKNYIKVLFKPGRPVQARELTQLQTVLQNQLGNFADHIFKEGSLVVPGDVSINFDVGYLKVESTWNDPAYSADTIVTENYYDEFLGTVVTGQTTGITAQVIAVEGSTGTDPITLFVRYLTAQSISPYNSTFLAEEVLASDAAIVRYAKVKATAHTPVGKGTVAFINDGIYYTKGSFVNVSSQLKVVSKYSDTPSIRVILNIEENVVTTADDGTLFDVAIGTPNYSAPGADRYQINLVLDYEDLELSNRTEDSYIQLAVIENGTIRSIIRDTTYSEIMKMIAKRTYEESGDYTVTPFLMKVKEHLDDGTNNGFLTSANGGDATKLAILFDAATGYVKGNRIEKISSSMVATDKARETETYNAGIINADIGMYMLVTNVVGHVDIDNFTTADLLHSGSPAPIGTARIRGMEYLSGTVGSTTSVYKLYLFDISLNTGFSISDVIGFNQGSGTFTCDLTGSPFDTTLYQSEKNTVLFPLPFTTVKSVTDIIYFSRKSFSGVVGSGYLTITRAGSELLVDDENWICVVTSGAHAGDYVSPSNVTINGGGISATITVGATYDTETITVIATVRKVSTEKTKTLSAEVTKTITDPTAGGTFLLDYADGYELVSVHMSADTSTTPTTADTDVTSRFTFNDGQQNNFYNLASIRLNGNAPSLTGQILVTYKYFQHGSGDYFSVDSYSTIDYENIPSYTIGGTSYRLSDVLDFRPVKNSSGNIITTSNVDALAISEFITMDIEYYLDRIDAFYLDVTGQINSVTGISSLSPKKPKVPNTGMLLYYLYLNAYTFDTKDAAPEYIENKRYTMRDIGKLEKRIKNLEYYATLSLLEKELTNAQLYDGDGALRFKNGFAVDSFKGFGVVAVEHPDFKASLDTRFGFLLPSFRRKQINLEMDELTSTAQKTGSVVTLPYTTTPFISQPYCSQWENVNPFNVFVWIGNITLNPSQDEWTETEYLPDVIINDNYINDDYIDYLNSIYGGTRYGDWEVVDTQTESILYTSMFYNDTKTETKTTTTSEREITTTTFSYDEYEVDLGDRVVNISFAAYIRPRRVYFKAEKMKPNTKVYPRFDDVAIDAWCTEEAFVSDPVPETQIISNGEANALIEHPDGPSELITDSSGKIEGSFFIQPKKFNTGTRIFRLSDSETHNYQHESTSAFGLYDAQGIVQQLEDVILSTRALTVDSITTIETSTTTLKTTNVLVDGAYTNTDIYSDNPCSLDPLSESIYIDSELGIFTPYVKLYFRSKDSVIPITVDLVVMENGYPTTTRVPFSSVTKYPADITTSTDGSVATTFTFESPVYLSPHKEYAIRMLSNSDEYEVYVAQVGETDLTNPSYVITSQPYIGSLFKSQNSSTWTADQTKDLKFELGRCVFSIDTSYDVIFNNVDNPNVLLPSDAFTTTNGSNVVRVFHPNHGFVNNTSNVTFSTVAANGVTADSPPQNSANGIPIDELNTTFTSIQNVEYDYYEIVTTTVATSTGPCGGNVIVATDNSVMDQLYPRVNEINIENSRTTWSCDLCGAGSLAGDQSLLYTPISAQNILVNRTLSLPSPCMVASLINETNEYGGNKSFTLTGSLYSADDRISPIVDLENTYVGAIAFRIDNPSGDSPTPSGYNAVGNFVDETEAYDGSALARSITNRFDISTPASSLKVYYTVNMPPEAGVRLYYKIRESGDDSNFNDLGWEGPVSPVSAITISEDPAFVTEAEYTIDETTLSNREFTSYAIKLVMVSTNTSKVPRISEFRTIAAT